jgi:hypothetical protein
MKRQSMQCLYIVNMFTFHEQADNTPIRVAVFEIIRYFNDTPHVLFFNNKSDKLLACVNKWWVAFSNLNHT